MTEHRPPGIGVTLLLALMVLAGAAGLYLAVLGAAR